MLSQMILSRSGDVYIAPEQRFMEINPEKAVLSHINGTLAIGDNICDH